MTQVILNRDQASVVRHASGIVEILDESGILVGYVTRQPLASPEEIAEADKRAAWNGPWHTTEQLLARLQALGQQ
jgi:hypothetical protein